MLHIIRASAGSGKTYTLVAEYLKIALKERGHFKHILAITFTNKAAGEMKERVLQFLSEIINRKNENLSHLLLSSLQIDEEELIRRARECRSDILHHYSEFAISTIDSFVHKIVSAFAWDLKLPLGFRAELDSDKLMDDLIELLFRNVHADRKELCQVLIEFTRHKLEDSGAWKIDREIKSIAFELLKDEATLFLPALSHFSDADFSAFRKNILNIQQTFEEEITSLAEDALTMIRLKNIDESSFYRGAVPKYFGHLAAGDYENIDGMNSTTYESFHQNKWYKKGTPLAVAQLIDSIAPDLLSLYHRITALKKQRGALYFLSKLLQKNMFTVSLLSELARLLQEHRQKTRTVHISEFQKRIHDIVRTQDAPIVYERIGERFQHIMIDEFQDTSELQWHNLLPLIENAQIEGGESLIVGDGKQAIYRFRNGKAEQFIALPNIPGSEADPRLKERENNIAQYGISFRELKTNFRSLPEIIAFNKLFYDVMEKDSHLLHDPQIYAGHAQEQNKKVPSGYVRIQRFPKKAPKGEVGSYVEWVQESILRIIHELFEKGYKGGDIALLMQRNKSIPNMAGFLIQHGIAVESPESLWLTSSPTVRLLEGMLTILVYPDDQILWMTLWQHTREHFGLPLSYQQEKNPGTLTELEDSLRTIIPEFTSFSRYATRHLFDVFQEWIRIFQLEKTPDPFLTTFSELVLQYTIDYSGFHAREFLQWWEEEKEKKSVAVQGSEDAVKLMTIHKSKGLQFPVVILPEGNHDFSVKGKTKLFWVNNVHPELEPMNVLLIENQQQNILETAYAPLAEREAEQVKLDALNLMYVATTRPEERLYIFTLLVEGKTNEPNNGKYFFQQFLEAHTHDPDIALWEMGDPNFVKAKKPKAQEVPDYPEIEAKEAAPPHRFHWRRDEDAFEPEEQKASLEYGNSLHLLLENTLSLEQLEHQLNRIRLQMGLNKNQVENLRQDALFVFTHESLQFLYQEHWEIINERPFLSEVNQRADRIYIKPDQSAAVVVDYKTGKEKSRHREQILSYGKMLQEMGIAQVRCFILYTQSKKIVDICL